MLTLVVDTREGHVIPHLIKNNIPHIVRQITTGDYAILKGDQICISIERKTLKDFGSSFKDGRYDNKQKMIELREQTNCSLLFIVEGTPSLSRYYSGIHYKNIESSIIHMALRDGITPVFTKSAIDTALFLQRLLNSAETLYKKWDPFSARKNSATIDTEPTNVVNNSTREPASNAENNAETARENDFEDAGENVEENAGKREKIGGFAEDSGKIQLALDTLTKRKDKPIKDIVAVAWSSIQGLTVNQVEPFTKWSLRELICGEVSDPQTVVRAGGRAFTKGTYSKIRRPELATCIDVLHKIGGKKSISALLSTYNPQEIAKLNREDFANFKCGKSKLGKKGEKLWEILNYKI